MQASVRVVIDTCACGRGGHRWGKLPLADGNHVPCHIWVSNPGSAISPAACRPASCGPEGVNPHHLPFAGSRYFFLEAHDDLG